MKSSNRWIWFVAMALLTVGLLGASWVFQNDRGVSAQSPGKTSTSIGNDFYLVGWVDVPDGLIPLVPLQPGPVTSVFVSEREHVAKGTELLRVKDDAFAAIAAQAEISINIARSQLNDARYALSQQDERIRAQEAVIKAADEKRQAAEQEAERQKILNKEQRIGNSETPRLQQVHAAEAIARAAKEDVEVQKSRLAALRIDTDRLKTKIAEAEQQVTLREKQHVQAMDALERCILRAPQDGEIIRKEAAVGTIYPHPQHVPAIVFAPDGKRIVRVDVDQEWASRVEPDMLCEIQDETEPKNGQKFTGRVEKISNAFLPRRNSLVPDTILATSNPRVLEAIVEFDSANGPLPRIGQKMRVTMKQNASDGARTAMGKR